jgi:hypothetical protein
VRVLRQHRRHRVDQARGGGLRRQPGGIDHGGGAGVEWFAAEQDGAQPLSPSGHPPSPEFRIAANCVTRQQRNSPVRWIISPAMASEVHIPS